jgi:hypothetical protein
MLMIECLKNSMLKNFSWNLVHLHGLTDLLMQAFRNKVMSLKPSWKNYDLFYCLCYVECLF